MANNSAEVRSILKDVTIRGCAVVNKKKLLWLLGWGQDREGAWKELLVHWEEIGEAREKLTGIEVWDNVILYMTVNHQPEPVLKWAGG